MSDDNQAELKALLEEIEELEDELPEDAPEFDEAKTNLRRRLGREVTVPVAGRMNSDETASVPNREARTNTKEVPVEGGDVDDPDTTTVEYEERGPSLEAINEYHGWLEQQMVRANKEANEREAPTRGAIPTYEYMNDDGGEPESEVPVAGRRE